MTITKKIALVTGGNIHPFRMRNASQSFHLSPGVNERIIADSLIDRSVPKCRLPFTNRRLFPPLN